MLKTPQYPTAKFCTYSSVATFAVFLNRSTRFAHTASDKHCGSLAIKLQVGLLSMLNSNYSILFMIKCWPFQDSQRHAEGLGMRLVSSPLTISYICIAIWTLSSLYSMAFLKSSWILFSRCFLSSLFSSLTWSRYSRELVSTSLRRSGRRERFSVDYGAPNRLSVQAWTPHFTHAIVRTSLVYHMTCSLLIAFLSQLSLLAVLVLFPDPHMCVPYRGSGNETIAVQHTHWFSLRGET